MRHPTPAPPAEIGVHDGLAFTLWMPDEPPEGGILILHGADSQKENHHDFARAARDAGFAALAFDQRGHGASEGELGGRAIEDVAGMAELLRRSLPEDAAQVALRGSSMGGYFALVAAGPAGAAAVVAICPAGGEDLLRGLRADRFAFAADRLELERLLESHDVNDAAAGLTVPLLLLHAEGDESIPASHSEALYEEAGTPAKRLIVLPGGHHSSVQHDAEMQGEALRFVSKAFRGRI